jgi:hypothetical protein
MSTVVRTASCFTVVVSHKCHQYGVEEFSNRPIAPPSLDVTTCRWARLWVAHYAEGIREKDWEESVAPLLCGTGRKANSGGDLAEDQPRVWEIDVVAAEGGRPGVNWRGAVRGTDFS